MNKSVSPVLVFILFAGLVTQVNPVETIVEDDYAGSPETPATKSVLGPRMSGLLIKYFNSSISSPFNALLSGEVDLTDLDVWWNQTRIDLLFGDSEVQAAISPSACIIQFDFNNNATIPTYPNLTSPTAYRGFRQGVSCLVNKTYIIDEVCNRSHRIDTAIPRPKGDWWVNWDVSQYDPYGVCLGNYPYEFNATKAATLFDQAGFIEGETVNPHYDALFPASAQYLRVHPETSRDLEPLIFYIRNDANDVGRLPAGRILRDNLQKMGIPVNATEANSAVCHTKVMREADYHIYTGGWTFASSLRPLEIFTTEFTIHTDEGWMVNYVQFRNATYDELFYRAMSPSNLSLARDAFLECQKILVDEAVCVWLWSPTQIMGYRNINGVVNSRVDQIDNQWTFLNTRLGANATRTSIFYGLSDPPETLNVVTHYTPESFWSWRSPQERCLDLIYDTLLAYCPYDLTPGNVFGEGDRGGVMPWMAEDWELGAWESPYDPSENLTKLTYHLRDSIKWHDGVTLNSTDIKFTIEYLQGLGNQSSLYSSVADVHHVTTPNAYTVEVYENTSNIWTLDLIGKLPILPKHIFQNISDVGGYTPGANEGHPANQTLIGAGPWKYAFHNSSMLYLEANSEYFMETPPEAEIDYRYDWEMGCWIVDALDVAMEGEAHGTSGSNVPDAKWEPGCDIAKGDGVIDVLDLAKIVSEFNLTWGKSAKRHTITPPTDTVVSIETSENPSVIGENLTVNVKLENLTRLFGLQLKLDYDNNKLDCLDLTLNEIFTGSYVEVKNEVNKVDGLLWVSISATESTQPLVGNATLATITFNCTKPSGSTLDFWNTKLANYGSLGSPAQPTPHHAFDRGIMVGVSTPTGTNVTVAPAENTNVTFTETTTEGVTTLNITQPPSDEFTSVICADIQTTANFTGNVTIQFTYDPTGLSLEEEQSMRIWLWNESSQVWSDITINVDTLKNIVYGLAPHLSIYGVTRSINVGDIDEDSTVTVGTPETPPDPPLGLIALRYYDIQSTTGSTGPIPLQLEYEDASLPPEEEIFIQLLLWNQTPQEWVDITTSVNIDDNIVYGLAPHLSIYGVTARSQPPQGIIVTDASYSRTIVGQGYNVTINYTVWNLGDFTQEFDLILYGNQTTLQITPTILSPNTQISTSFVWNTTDTVKGNCSLNTCTHLLGWVFVTIPGDVDGDRDVDIFDIVSMAGSYGTNEGEPDYVMNYDIEGDGDIDIFDIVIAASNYGESW